MQQTSVYSVGRCLEASPAILPTSLLPRLPPSHFGFPREGPGLVPLASEKPA